MNKLFGVVLLLAGVAAGAVWRDPIVATVAPYATQVMAKAGLAPPISSEKPGAGSGRSNGAADVAASDTGKGKPQGGASSQDGGRRGGSGGPTRVATATAVNEDMPVTRRTIGTVTAPANLSVRSQAQGIVVAVLAKDGQIVRKGDVLARLDSRNAQATVAKDRAALARDQASLEHARNVLKRQQTLVSSNSISVQSLEDATTAVETAEATVALDQAVLDADLVALSYMEIKAPFDGRLGALNVVEGSLVQPSDVIVRLTATSPLQASFTLTEGEVATIEAAQTVGQAIDVIVSPLGSDRSYHGTVSFVDRLVDGPSGSFAVKAVLKDADSTLFPGQSLAVTVTLGERAVVAVPSVALQPTQSGTMVYVVGADGTVTSKPVTVALTDGDRAGIDSGIAAGDRVIVEGQVRLADGMKVIDTSNEQKAAEATPAGEGAEAASQPKGQRKHPAAANEVAQ